MRGYQRGRTLQKNEAGEGRLRRRKPKFAKRTWNVRWNQSDRKTGGVLISNVATVNSPFELTVGLLPRQTATIGKASAVATRKVRTLPKPRSCSTTGVVDSLTAWGAYLCRLCYENPFHVLASHGTRTLLGA